MAWCAMAIVVVTIVMTMLTIQPWWAYIDIFCAFMAVFCHIMSLYLKKMSIIAANKLEMISFVFVALTVVSFIVEYIVMHT